MTSNVENENVRNIETEEASNVEDVIVRNAEDENLMEAISIAGCKKQKMRVK